MRFIVPVVVLVALVGGCSKSEPPPLSSPQVELHYVLPEDMEKEGVMKKDAPPATKADAK